MTEVGDARALLSANAVRERAHELLAIGLEGGLAEWRVDLGRLDAAADLTAETVRANYPTLEVPFHARWRHFSANGRVVDIPEALASLLQDAAAEANARYPNP